MLRWSAPQSSSLAVTSQTEPKDYDFMNKLPERYTCLVCSSVQFQPVLVSCCGQHFCNSCLQRWFQQQGTKCPHCRETGITSIVNKQQVRDINDLMVYCSNKSKGCRWEGKIGAVDEHTRSKCTYTLLDCPNKCKEKVFRSVLETHLRDSCLCRKYRCEHCGLQGTYHSITGECGQHGPCAEHNISHYETCGHVAVQCPNNCSEILKKMDIATHREICPLEPVECPFAEVGCTERAARKNLDRHTATSDHHHLVLMMKAFKDLKQKVESLEQQRGLGASRQVWQKSNKKPRAQKNVTKCCFADISLISLKHTLWD